ncbi:hypothetical protein NPX13_g10266 [Xylaria arbuscula]|uniref:Protein kinase domain-containing protein n=1 Tax=Xylaria arbuscula TaxID=114810 RepID=A0A9W8TGR3_9PEZI|nr:hypothetical protein NPX13_g10266 [Xylaria arbuscula]
MPVYTVRGSEYDDDDDDLPDTLPPPSPPPQAENATDAEPNDKTSPVADPVVDPVVDPGEVAITRQSKLLYNWAELNLESISHKGEFLLRAFLITHLPCCLLSYPDRSHCDSWFSVDGADDESEPTRICAIGPGEKQVGVAIQSSKVRCLMFFDPADDRLIIINTMPKTLYCKSARTGATLDIPFNGTAVMAEDEWELSTGWNACHIQCKVLGRKPLRITQDPGTKRSSAAENHVAKRTRRPVGEDFNRVTIPRGSFPNNPLLHIVRGDAVHVETGVKDYTLKLLEPVADMRLESSFKAKHSRISGKIVVVKIIKPNSRRKESAVQAIETWIAEFLVHSSLGSHHAIVPYLGSDARFNALFTEYIDAKPLTYHVKDQSNQEFNDGIYRAWRILCDIASALSFLHSKKIIHGGIQLANILFHPVRGAVLANFSLSFKEGERPVSNGLPWYQPPQFLEQMDAHSTSMDMWALGVVMLWALSKIPMPESAKHWVVEHIHLEKAATDVVRKAETRMEDWLATVQAGSNTLQEEGEQMGELGEMAGLIGALVQQREQERIDAATLVEELAKFDLKS